MVSIWGVVGALVVGYTMGMVMTALLTMAASGERPPELDSKEAGRPAGLGAAEAGHD